ncbi:MAG: PH domain-containing protein [Actinobacteria bacterium]|nr:PH domain-containing protein [Actinomycetota bacterium]
MTLSPGAAPSAGGATQPQHVHPLTPWVHAMQAAPVLLIAVVVPLGNAGEFGAWIILVALVAVLLLVALIAGLAYLSWTRLTYWFDGQGDFRIDSGIVTRRERRLQLSRLQGVDVVQPLFARLVGMAALTIEVAGAGDSRASLQYLKYEQAQALRSEVLARAAGLTHDAGEAPEEPLVLVPPRDLAVSLLLRGTTVFLFLLTIALVILLSVTAGWAGLFMILTAGVPIIIVFTEFTQFFNFTVAKSPDGLRTKAGLFQVTAQTIPPGRVQAVEFVQSWLWRRRGWVRVRINVAGLSTTDDNGQNQSQMSTVLLPVAPYPVARQIVNYVLPDMDLLDIEMKAAPPRAHRRAWIQFRNLSVGWNDRVFVTERGKYVNRIAVVPHARTQSVRVTQGPWERSLGLASMHVDSPPGPVTVVALYREVAEAQRLAQEQNDRAQAALRADPSTHWMTQTGAGDSDEQSVADFAPPTGLPSEGPPPPVEQEGRPAAPSSNDGTPAGQSPPAPDDLRDS